MSEPADRRARREQGQRLLDRLAADYLDRAGVDRAAMFGSTGLRADGKFFAFVGARGGLIVKVPAARAAAVVAAGQATAVPGRAQHHLRVDRRRTACCRSGQPIVAGAAVGGVRVRQAGLSNQHR